ncbi:MAG: RNA polymerase sigma factor [Ignavibacteriaceae bacterium]|jgi:RNA polymerase sigma-70 factor (ECF subfamily)
MSVENLIENLKKGDIKSFRILVDEHQKKVLNTCYRFLNNKEDAEDLTQEVFIEVYKSISSFRGESEISTWIYRIAVTKSLDFIRKKKRKKRYAVLKRVFSDDTLTDTVPDERNLNPGLKTEENDRIRLLNKALESLPQNQRAAFTLSRYDEMSYKEIAEIMNTTISSVESLIHRAKNNLKKRLYHYYQKNII